MMVKAAVPTGELRKRFVNVSQRIGLLLARYERSAQWTHAVAEQEKLLRELEAERRDLEADIRSLRGEELWRDQLTSYLKLLTAATKAAKERVDVLKNEGT